MLSNRRGMSQKRGVDYERQKAKAHRAKRV
jgi:hypothetical protein